MFHETAIIERVETYVRHPVFAGSDEVMTSVLEDLEGRVETGHLSEPTFRRLREMILGSPHFRNN